MNSNHLTPLSRAVIQRRGPVQKHVQFTLPLSIQGEAGCPLLPRGSSGSSFLRTCGRGGCAKNQFPRDVARQVNEPGAAASRSSRPRRPNTRRGGPLATAPIQGTGFLPRPTPTQGALAPISRSVTHRGLGLMTDPVRRPGSRSPGSNYFRLSAATRRSGSKTVLSRSMK